MFSPITEGFWSVMMQAAVALPTHSFNDARSCITDGNLDGILRSGLLLGHVYFGGKCFSHSYGKYTHGPELGSSSLVTGLFLSLTFLQDSSYSTPTRDVLLGDIRYSDVGVCFALSAHNISIKFI